MNIEITSLDIQQHVDIKRPMEAVFEGLIEEMTDEMQYEDGRSMNMKLERIPGGRWFRDFGDGGGHLWGIVQSYRAPNLLELIGPTMMSYPAQNHIEYKLSEVPGGTRITFRHRAFGFIPAEHQEGMKEGWGMMMANLQKRLESGN